MQTTFTASIIKEQPNIQSICNTLDTVCYLHNSVERKLYAELMAIFSKNNTIELSREEFNYIKSSYQEKYKINSREFNSIHTTLKGKISSVMELSKGYLIDAKDKLISLNKTIKSKNKTLAELNIKLSDKSYIPNKFELINKDSLEKKLHYLNTKLDNANAKVAKLEQIEKSGNPQLCFGSNKLFRQQFQVNSENNKTKFKTHEDWLKAWIASRNKTFFYIGSSDETAGNGNCQISHIGNNIFLLTVNAFPKALKFKEQFICFQIKVHNDLKNNILHSLSDKKSRQAISYRFYKESDGYKVFISLDKAKQQPKVVSYNLLGTVGVDVNANHLSVTEINHHGNLIKTFDIELNIQGKTTEQAKNNIALAVKQLTDYAVLVSKPIILEKLKFDQKKKELTSGFNKNYNIMLSSFAYSKIIQLIKSRAFDKGIEVIDVNPTYTSKIGKFKYQELYKLTTHQAASFVIARRGLLSYEKVVNVKFKDKKTGMVTAIKKTVTVINKEKTISISNSKHYGFDLPARKNQGLNNVYWKEIEQSYRKVKAKRILLQKSKRKNNKKLILAKLEILDLGCEILLVADNFGEYRNPSTTFIPF